MMRLKKNLTGLFFTLLFTILLGACHKEQIKPTSDALDINNFIWENMNDNYLWYDQMPQNIDLTKEIDPKAYFSKLLYTSLDKWSFITDDYQGLMDMFKGVKKSSGMHFKLYLLPNTNELIGVVQYVIPGSPAADVQVQRGDIFYMVNGMQLTVSNYQDLLFNNSNTLKFTFAHYDLNNQLIPDSDKSLTQIELTENPIFISKTIDYAGAKIGYLTYNQFISDYNDSLENVFSQFKSDGITDLVLDLRYNPGGAISNAIHLSSMIAPASVVNNREVYSKLIWNDKVNQAIIDQEGTDSENLVTHFEVPTVNLDLHKIYVLVTSATASASELLINCLSPYMEVVLIGQDHTTGKYVGSVTIYDPEKSHGWAMQPIVLKSANANGVTDYVNGFTPDYTINDDLTAPLGSLDEDMLAKAAELITGQPVGGPARTASSALYRQLTPFDQPANPRDNIMYLDR